MNAVGQVCFVPVCAVTHVDGAPIHPRGGAIRYRAGKYFGGGVLTGCAGSALVPRSQIIYLRAAPFLMLGVAGIVADWWENSTACTEKTREQFQAFVASQRKQR